METRSVERVQGAPRLGMTGFGLLFRIDQTNLGLELEIAVAAEDNGETLLVLDSHTIVQ